MLFLLRDEGGFEGKMIGVDYSAQSIELCEKRLHGLLKSDLDRWNNMEFALWDIMSTKTANEWMESWDVVLDKGTFDAISLSEEKDSQGRRLCEGYREKVEALVKPGGMLVVTSCNWTEGELRGWLGIGELEAVGRVDYHVFKFGGQTGQSISTVCFRRKV